ncbi:hypothetical protein FQZ97_926550 [compost metagenome]
MTAISSRSASRRTSKEHSHAHATLCAGPGLRGQFRPGQEQRSQRTRQESDAHGLGAGRQRRRQHSRLDRRPAKERRQRRRRGQLRRPFRQRAAAFHRDRAEPGAVQGIPQPWTDRPVQALPGQLQDAGLSQPSQRQPTPGRARAEPRQCRQRDPGRRRQRPARLPARHSVPTAHRGYRGDVEPHDPLARR